MVACHFEFRALRTAITVYLCDLLVPNLISTSASGHLNPCTSELVDVRRLVGGTVKPTEAVGFQVISSLRNHLHCGLNESARHLVRIRIPEHKLLERENRGPRSSSRET